MPANLKNAAAGSDELIRLVRRRYETGGMLVVLSPSEAAGPASALGFATSYTTPYGAFDCHHAGHELSMNNPVEIPLMRGDTRICLYSGFEQADWLNEYRGIWVESGDQPLAHRGRRSGHPRA